MPFNSLYLWPRFQICALPQNRQLMAVDIFKSLNFIRIVRASRWSFGTCPAAQMFTSTTVYLYARQMTRMTNWRTADEWTAFRWRHSLIALPYVSLISPLASHSVYLLILAGQWYPVRQWGLEGWRDHGKKGCCMETGAIRRRREIYEHFVNWESQDS